MADRQLIAHLLRRATFGPTAAEIDAAEAAGFDATLAALVRPTGPDALTLPQLGADPYAILPANAGRDARQKAQTTARDQIQALIGWWLDRMVTAPHQFSEKMLFFWHGHWATSVQKVKSAGMMLGQLQTMRQYGSGDFAVMVKQMLRDPALILWLDGQQNTARAPNENLAREVMELFTLGIGAYTEDDVKAAARSLTGWTLNRSTLQSVFVPNRHDNTNKTLLGQTGNYDVDTFADLLVSQDANAAFLARRLWFRFASGEPMPDATGQRLVAAYRPGRDLTALVSAVFRDEAFPGTRSQLVKQPIEWMIGAVRQLSIAPAQLAPDRKRQLLGGLNGLGQVPLQPPSVGGWPADAAWLTTSSLQVRLRVAVALAAAAGPSVVDSLS
ncbi:MAG TPA: DUF1800 domain-containing protein, partial [Candidatus Limnocylindria bacterium]|nr:DUF1800 domain-containing protein [Candidatus Limnocylindria bacterium]